MPRRPLPSEIQPFEFDKVKVCLVEAAGGEVGGFADIGRFELMPGRTQPLGNSRVFKKKCLLSIREQEASVRANLLHEMF